MIKNTINYSIIQMFFTQRANELLDRRTIDTYGTKVMNPLLIVKELVDTLQDCKKGLITFDNNIPTIVSEIDFLFDREIYLNFENVTKDYFISELKKIKSDKFDRLLVVAKKIIDDNKNYRENLFDNLVRLCDKTFDNTEDLASCLKKVNEISSFLFSQLLGEGFSKSYLRQQVKKRFSPSYNFKSSLETFRLKTDFEPKTFNVIFKCSSISIDQEKILKEKIDITNNINPTIKLLHDFKVERLNNYRKTGKSARFITLEVKAKDAYMAFIEGKRKISKELDLFHFSFLDDGIHFFNKILVIEGNKNRYWNLIDVDYKIESEFNTGTLIYEKFSEKLDAIYNRKKLDQITKSKIQSAIRYLRLAHESKEIEHKFLNYWIGLEHLFSLSDKSSSITNIKSYFTRMHSNYYLGRIISEFHSFVSRSPVKKNISEFNEDSIEAFFSEKIYKEISDVSKTEHPLLFLRTQRLKHTLFGSDSKSNNYKKFLLKHENMLNQHLTRMYRIRNKIVHDAATDLNIILITANIKYYLLFALEKIINEFSNEESCFDNLKEFYQLHYVSFDNQFVRKDDFKELKTLLNLSHNQDFFN